MRGPFKADRRGVRVLIPTLEREVLVQLLGQLDELLDDGTPEPTDPLEAMLGLGSFDDPSAPPPTTPEDPAVARLLPDGNRDDPELSGEFRRFTEYGLRSRKRSGARTAATALSRAEPVLLDDEEALCLLKALTDIRLVMGERLELRTDEDAVGIHDRLATGDGDEVWLATAATYELLTIWQEYLVGAVSKRS